MKGVILAGGTGTRLRPYTLIANKHTAPIAGGWPMILYPLKTLIDAGINDILVITGRPNQEFGEQIMQLLGSGKRLHEIFGSDKLNVDITYRVQDEAGGIAQAIGLAEKFVGNEKFVVILGDNIFGDNIHDHVKQFEQSNQKAKIFLKEVDDPWRFGVAELKGDRVVGIEEKPKTPKSKYAVTGLYMYDGSNVFDIIKQLKPSGRGELEVTDINNAFVANGTLGFAILKSFWTDAGTPESLERAAAYIKQAKQNSK